MKLLDFLLSAYIIWMSIIMILRIIYNRHIIEVPGVINKIFEPLKYMFIAGCILAWRQFG